MREWWCDARGHSQRPWLYVRCDPYTCQLHRNHHRVKEPAPCGSRSTCRIVASTLWKTGTRTLLIVLFFYTERGVVESRGVATGRVRCACWWRCPIRLSGKVVGTDVTSAVSQLNTLSSDLTNLTLNPGEVKFWREQQEFASVFGLPTQLGLGILGFWGYLEEIWGGSEAKFCRNLSWGFVALVSRSERSLRRDSV